MEPRSLERGERDSGHGTTRRRTRFNGAALVRARRAAHGAVGGRREDASMEPRSLERGETRLRETDILVSPGFNGAALVRARRAGPPAFRTPWPKRFNGAALVRARRGTYPGDGANKSGGFNGAALVRARREGGRLSDEQREFMLQWSRAR